MLMNMRYSSQGAGLTLLIMLVCAGAVSAMPASDDEAPFRPTVKRAAAIIYPAPPVKAGAGYAYGLGIGPPPPGAQKPSVPYPWFGDRVALDAGWCAYAPGSGWSGELVWPVSVHDDVRPFEPGHIAIDITGSTGDTVVAAAAGLVVWAGYSSWGGGNIIALAHGGGWLTIYAHLNGVDVGCHQMVRRGEAIGTLGQSGGTSWPHVHLEVHHRGFAYDPVSFLP